MSDRIDKQIQGDIAIDIRMAKRMGLMGACNCRLKVYFDGRVKAKISVSMTGDCGTIDHVRRMLVFIARCNGVGVVEVNVKKVSLVGN